jgi:hypothetical protein
MLRKLFTLLVIFIVFYLGAHFYLRWKNRVEVDTIKTTKLIDCEPNQVRGIRVQQGESGKDEVLKFTRVDTPEAGVPPAEQLARAIWRSDTGNGAEADVSVLNHLASLACEIYDPIPKRAGDFKSEEKPSWRARSIEFTLGAGEKSEAHTVEFGPVGSDRQNLIRYRSAGTQQVAEISPQLLELASQPPQKFLSSRVLRMTADDIQTVAASYGGKEKFTLERVGSDWRMLVKGKASKGREDPDRFVNRLATLRALTVRPGQAENCGKGPSKVEFRLRGLGGKEELVAFDYGKSGSVTACSSARDALFGVHRDMLKYLDLTTARK